MKKVIFIWIVALAVCAYFIIHFCFPPKVRAGEKAGLVDDRAELIEIFRQLCSVNAELSDEINEQSLKKTGKEVFYLMDQNFKIVGIIPKSFFFFVLADLVEASERDNRPVNYRELIRELTKDNIIMRATLKNILAGNVRHEKIR